MCYPRLLSAFWGQMGAAEIKAAAAGAEPLCRGSIDLELTEKLPLEESENSPDPHRRNRYTHVHITHTWRAHP